LKKKDFGKNP
jgi:uncharacterized protein YecE (DUF72 family)